MPALQTGNHIGLPLQILAKLNHYPPFSKIANCPVAYYINEDNLQPEIVGGELKSPLIPLFQRGNFLRRTLTPLWKRGEGEIYRQHEAVIMWRISETGQ